MKDENPNVERITRYINDLYYDNGYNILIYLSYGIPKIKNTTLNKLSEEDINELYVLKSIDWLKTRHLYSEYMGDDANRVMPIDIARLAHNLINSIQDEKIIVSLNYIGYIKLYTNGKLYDCIFNMCRFKSRSVFSGISLGYDYYVFQTYIPKTSNSEVNMTYIIKDSFNDCMEELCKIYKKKRLKYGGNPPIVVECYIADIDIPDNILYYDAISLIKEHDEYHFNYWDNLLNFRNI